jgi:hypothetical protein
LGGRVFGLVEHGLQLFVVHGAAPGQHALLLGVQLDNGRVQVPHLVEFAHQLVVQCAHRQHFLHLVHLHFEQVRVFHISAQLPHALPVLLVLLDLLLALLLAIGIRRVHLPLPAFGAAPHD